MAFTLGRAKPSKEIQKFPYTVPAIAFLAFGGLTLSYISLATDVNAALAQKAVILSEILVLGLVLSIITALAFDRSLTSLIPESLATFLTTRQAIVTVAGFLILGAFQVTINQFALSTLLVSTSPTTKVTFNSDAAISEEAFFSSFLTVLLWRSFLQITQNGGFSAFGTLLLTAAIFMVFHSFVYGTNLQQLYFVFGARIILGTVFLYTRSLVAPTFIHWGWNLLTSLTS